MPHAAVSARPYDPANLGSQQTQEALSARSREFCKYDPVRIVVMENRCRSSTAGVFLMITPWRDVSQTHPHPVFGILPLKFTNRIQKRIDASAAFSPMAYGTSPLSVVSGPCLSTLMHSCVERSSPSCLRAQFGFYDALVSVCRDSNQAPAPFRRPFFSQPRTRPTSKVDHHYLHGGSSGHVSQRSRLFRMERIRCAVHLDGHVRDWPA